MAVDVALAIVLYNALKDKIYGETPPVTNGKTVYTPNGNGDGLLHFPTGHPCAGMTAGSPAYISCVTTYGGPTTHGNGNGNGNGPDVVGPEPVEFDITTLPEYAGQVAPDGVCPMHYTNVQVTGPYHVCQRSDLV